ncbi:hypothetical protein LZ32DRAFT_619945 [Colletotrichum eremochloae]|nr:hypothetical protein LZ32DRAFT_619945 [Colletotrichum eremochloae]
MVESDMDMDQDVDTFDGRSATWKRKTEMQPIVAFVLCRALSCTAPDVLDASQHIAPPSAARAPGSQQCQACRVRRVLRVGSAGSCRSSSSSSSSSTSSSFHMGAEGWVVAKLAMRTSSSVNRDRTGRPSAPRSTHSEPELLEGMAAHRTSLVGPDQ